MYQQRIAKRMKKELADAKPAIEPDIVRLSKNSSIAKKRKKKV
jgi:hypothetical protein